MKKKIIFAIITGVVIIAIFVLRNWDVNPTKDIKLTDIQEIMIANPKGYYNVTKQEDIKVIMKELQSMKLYRRRTMEEKEAFSFLIDIKLSNSETIQIVINSTISISGKRYKSNKAYEDYIEAFRNIFENLKGKYDWNPA